MELYRGGRFGIIIGDITELEVEAIVSSTNPDFVCGKGVDAAILEAAGPEMAKACMALGSATFGEARITPGFSLPAKHVMHVVTPLWQEGGEAKRTQLAALYREALTLAKDHAISTIAFPAIGTGACGYPFEAATSTALETCGAFVAEQPDVFSQVVFCAFTAADGEVFNRLAKHILA